MNKLYENIPNMAPEGPLRTDRKGITLQSQARRSRAAQGLSDKTTGPLSVVGDPVGQVLDKGLSPIGHVTGQVGKPSGQALLDVQKQMKEEAGYSDKTKVEDKGPGGDSVGGKEQNAKNPLGL